MEIKLHSLSALSYQLISILFFVALGIESELIEIRGFFCLVVEKLGITITNLVFLGSYQFITQAT